MGNPREPWIKVKVGTVRNAKLLELVDDSARWGYLKVLTEAKTQRRMGVFGGRSSFVEVLGRHGAYLDDYIDADLLEVSPDLCAGCRERHAPDRLRPGDIVVHDFLLEQRDPTNTERQGNWRKLQQALTLLREAGIELPVTDDVTAQVTLHSVTGLGPRPVEVESIAHDVTPSAVRPTPIRAHAPRHNGGHNARLTRAGDDGDRDRERDNDTTKKNLLEGEVVAETVVEPRATSPRSTLVSQTRPEPMRPLTLVPPRVGPTWRTPCRNYSAHQSSHRIVDGQAVCERCEDEAAAAKGSDPAPTGSDPGQLGLLS